MGPMDSEQTKKGVAWLNTKNASGRKCAAQKQQRAMSKPWPIRKQENWPNALIVWTFLYLIEAKVAGSKILKLTIPKVLCIVTKSKRRSWVRVMFIVNHPRFNEPRTSWIWQINPFLQFMKPCGQVVRWSGGQVFLAGRLYGSCIPESRVQQIYKYFTIYSIFLSVSWPLKPHIFWKPMMSAIQIRTKIQIQWQIQWQIKKC